MEPQDPTAQTFFMAALLLIYERDGAQKQRHMNILFASPDGQISREGLSGIQATAMQRLHVENGIEPEQVKDVIFLNVFYLITATQEAFLGQLQQEETLTEEVAQG